MLLIAEELLTANQLLSALTHAALLHVTGDHRQVMASLANKGALRLMQHRMDIDQLRAMLFPQ